MRSAWSGLWLGSLLGVFSYRYAELPVYGLVLILSFIFFAYPRALLLSLGLGALSFLFHIEVHQYRALRPELLAPQEVRFCVERQTDYGSLVQILKAKSSELEGRGFYGPERLRPGDCHSRFIKSFGSLASRQKSKFPPDELKRERDGPVGRLRYEKQSRGEASSQEPYFSLAERLTRALVRGESWLIPSELWDQARRLGIAHLFVVSGMHMGFLFFGFSFLFIRLLRWKNLYAFGLTSLMGFLYLFYFDLGLPAWRAFSFFSFGSILLYILPPLRRLPRAEVCAFVGFVFLLVDPIRAMTASYILSFGVSYSLLKCRLLPLSGLIASLAAGCLCSFLGMPTSVLSPIFNMIFIPIFSLIIFPIFILRSFLSWFEPLSQKIAEAFVSMTATCDRFVGYLPYFQLEANAALLLWIALLAFSPIEKRKTCGLALGVWLLMAAGAIFIRSEFQYRNIVEAIDVGQGDAYLIRLDQTTILLDGGKRAFLEEELRQRSVGSVDLWIISHFDDDHFRAFMEVSKNFKVKEIWIPRFDDSEASKYLLAEYPGRVKTSTKTELSWHSENFTLIGSSLPPRSKMQQVKNRDSLVVELYARGKLRGLFLGDLPSASERKWLKSQALKQVHRLHFLKIAHHG